MVAQMFNLLPAQGKAASMKEVYAQINEGKKQKQVERGHGVCTY